MIRLGICHTRPLISGHDVRIRELAALLRFGDELADENSRASSYLLKKDLIT